MYFFSFFKKGCAKCYARGTHNPVTQNTKKELRERMMRKTKYLESCGYNVVEMWECDLKRALECDDVMKEYFDNYDIVDPLEPREAFFGRTNAVKLFHECEENEKIR